MIGDETIAVGARVFVVAVDVRLEVRIPAMSEPEAEASATYALAHSWSPKVGGDWSLARVVPGSARALEEVEP